MSREKIKSKYGMSLKPETRPPDLVSWKYSSAVMRLRSFILENRHHGIHVVIRGGRPVLQFVPGLKRGNEDRWKACLTAEILLLEAAGDIIKLMKQKKLELNENATDPGDPEQSEQSVLL